MLRPVRRRIRQGPGPLPRQPGRRVPARLGVGKRLLRQRKIPLAEDAGAPLGEHALRGRRGGPDAGARAAVAHQGTSSRARSAGPASRRPDRRRRRNHAERHHRPSSVGGPGHHPTSQWTARGLRTSPVLPLVAERGVAGPSAEHRRGRWQGLAARTRQPLREPGPGGRRDQGASRLRRGREGGQAVVARTVSTPHGRHRDDRVCGHGQAGARGPRRPSPAHDPRPGRSAAVHRRLQRPCRSHHRGRRGRPDPVFRPAAARGGGPVCARWAPVAPMAPGPLPNHGPALRRRSPAGHPRSAAAQEAQRRHADRAHVRGTRRRSVAPAAGHQARRPERGPSH